MVEQKRETNLNHILQIEKRKQKQSEKCAYFVFDGVCVSEICG